MKEFYKDLIISIDQEIETDVLDKFFFPVLFSVHLIFSPPKLTFMPPLMMQFGKSDSFPCQGWYFFPFKSGPLK